MEGGKPASLVASGELQLILVALIMGAVARILALKEDYRQYPSYPQGYLIHLVTGIIASALGAVAIPALLARNYTAVTFLSIAIQHFRDIRKAEKDSLKDLESTEFAPRGEAYIDGISKTFESRNYFALVVSMVTSTVITLVPARFYPFNIIIGVIVGAVAFWIIYHFASGKFVGDVAEVKAGGIEVRGAELYVDGFFVSAMLGTSFAQTMMQEDGLAVVVTPHDTHSRVVMDNAGQRQAMLSEATRALGVKKYYFVRKDFQTGRLFIALVPIHKDPQKLMYVLRHTPLLETVKKSPAMMDTEFLEE